MVQALPAVGAGLAKIGGGSAIAGALNVAGTAAAIGGTAASIQQSRRAERAAEKADEVGRAQAEIANQRSIRQNLIRSRAQQAQLISQGQAQTGSFGGTSAVQGALGSARTQAGANVGFANTAIAANAEQNRQAGISRSAQGRAATFGSVAALPGQFGFDLASIFEGN